jgi:hypothetical protein
LPLSKRQKEKRSARWRRKWKSRSRAARDALVSSLPSTASRYCWPCLAKKPEKKMQSPMLLEREIQMK